MPCKTTDTSTTKPTVAQRSSVCGNFACVIAYALTHAKFPQADLLWATVSFVVLVSVVLHGIAVTPVMTLLDRWKLRTHSVTETR